MRTHHLAKLVLLTVITAWLGACGDTGELHREAPSTEPEADASDTSPRLDDAGQADAGDIGSREDTGGAATPPADWQHDNDADPTLVAKRLEGAVELDGVLDEQDWQAAMVVSFEDKDSSDGTSDNTIAVRTLWDEDSLYIGALV